MQCTVDREHPLEHLEEALDLHISTGIKPWVCLGTAAEPPFNGTICRHSKGLSNESAIMRGCVLSKESSTVAGETICWPILAQSTRTFQFINSRMSFGSGFPLRANPRFTSTVGCSTFEAVDIQILYDFGIVSGRRSQEYMICPQLSRVNPIST